MVVAPKQDGRVGRIVNEVVRDAAAYTSKVYCRFIDRVPAPKLIYMAILHIMVRRSKRPAVASTNAHSPIPQVVHITAKDLIVPASIYVYPGSADIPYYTGGNPAVFTTIHVNGYSLATLKGKTLKVHVGNILQIYKVSQQGDYGLTAGDRLRRPEVENALLTVEIPLTQ
jgi:hypothetical protein